MVRLNWVQKIICLWITVWDASTPYASAWGESASANRHTVVLSIKKISFSFELVLNLMGMWLRVDFRGNIIKIKTRVTSVPWQPPPTIPLTMSHSAIIHTFPLFIVYSQLGDLGDWGPREPKKVALFSAVSVQPSGNAGCFVLRPVHLSMQGYNNYRYVTDIN